MKASRLVAIVLPLTLLLAACEKTDTDLALDFVNSWLESRGAVYKSPDGSYKPTLKGITVATGWGTTDDPTADAALQAGKVAKDIADNDKLMKEGEAAFNKDPPDTKTGKEKMDAAVNNRPDDWYYRNHRAYVYLEQGNDTAAKKDLQAGVDGCAGNQSCLAALHRDRANFYTSAQAGAFISADPNLRSCAIVSMGAQSLEALAGYSTGTAKDTYASAAQTARSQVQTACAK